LPGLPQRVVEAVQPPQREQVGDRAAVDPHGVDREQRRRGVGVVGHREQRDGHEVDAGLAGGLLHESEPMGLVAVGGAEVGQPRPAGRAGEVERVAHERVERERGAVAAAVAAGGGEDGGGVGRHVRRLRDRRRPPPGPRCEKIGRSGRQRRCRWLGVLVVTTRTTGVGLRSERGPVLLATMLSTGLVAIDATILATAVPAIVNDLGGFTQAPWLFSVYLLAQAATVPIYGKLADVVGRKPVMVAGVVAFLVGSVLCALAPSM